LLRDLQFKSKQFFPLSNDGDKIIQFSALVLSDLLVIAIISGVEEALYRCYEALNLRIF